MAAGILFTSTVTISSSLSTLKKSRQSPSPSLLSSLKPDGFSNSSLPLSRSSIQKHRCSAIAAVPSLPTAKPDRVSLENYPQWSARAIRSYGFAGNEARRLKSETTGTHFLLMGVMIEGTTSAAIILRAYGITLLKLREEIINLLEGSYLSIIREEFPPLTEQSQRALDWAVDEKLKSGESGEITTTHLVLGIWSEKDSPGHKMMAGFGFDDEKAAELAKFVDEDAVC